jgi:4-amino-4-deoxy-L-arabinose transferase-like glycosyltransferase
LNVPAASPRRPALILLLLSLALYGTALGAAPIHRHQESRVAETAREMLVSGDLVVPHLNGMVRLNKPPVVYWASLGSYKLLGRVSELAARLPVALCAIAGIFLTAALGARLFGARAGFIAGAVLATIPLYLSQGRRAETDVPLTLFVTLALYAFERGFRERATAWKWLFFAAMGLAFMCKGVPGLVVPLLGAVLCLLWEGRGREALRPSFFGGLLLTLLIIAPWYALVWTKFPDAGEVFRFETLRRLGGSAPHAHSFLYYFYVAPLRLLPCWRSPSPGRASAATRRRGAPPAFRWPGWRAGPSS